ncbi:MAG TPA: valine--tRNA ligase [Fastidiosipila sp.]|nr:valine--tRNA ligase [Fastidiosipila sp.]
MDHISKTFEPGAVEPRLYAAWQDEGAFQADADSKKRPFTIIMPPPNITGQLHLGHALDSTLQDAVIRYRRLIGDEALWLPGTDHAAIATEARVVSHLKAQGIEKKDLTREEFLVHAWEWKRLYGDMIVDQLKRLGSSCDWSRLAFTMDEPRSKAVVEVFVRLYEEGLIYRGQRIINWCSTCKTTISDAEVDYEEDTDRLYYVRYPFVSGEGHVLLATTRPETMFADVAVAVHPEDSRYTGLVGKLLHLPLTNKQIPVIADSYVDPEFGSGAVKITPGHDPNDYEVGERHDLPIVTVLDEAGILTDETGPYAGMDVKTARKHVVAALEEKGFLEKTTPHKHNVGHCYRCQTRIEPRVSEQWFVEMKPLADPALEAVRTGQVQFIPEHFSKTYFNWMENIRDWNISRQLWWGHQIPAYYCDECGKIEVARSRPAACSACGNETLRQDEDTLDTWFSSALWPFSTLGWPEQTADLEKFYPTNLLVTGYDIIFFWVARMIFSGIHQTGQVPFPEVLIHGIIRDEQGRKMSKSLNNGIDPLEVIDKYGADALRYALLANSSKGLDQRFSEARVEAGRNFINKMWNAFRYFLMQRTDEPLERPARDQLKPEDRWILTGLTRLVTETTEHMEHYDFNLALAKIYSFLWDYFCDWYIEMTKVRFQGDDKASAKIAEWVMNEVLCQTMTLLHPFMPFVTEEIWQHLWHEDTRLIVSSWPKADRSLEFTSDYETMERLMEVIRQIRNIRAEYRVAPKQEIATILVVEDKAILKSLVLQEAYIKRLAKVSNVSPRSNDRDVPKGVVTAPFDGGVLFVPLESLVDPVAEKTRLEKELEKVTGEIASIEKKLANTQFVEKAPEAVVQVERDKLEAKTEAKAHLEKRLSDLSAML